MKILFLCIANSARSQMAEGLARNILGDRAEIQSAGAQSWMVHPYSKQVLEEIGIDISKQYSKSINELSPQFVSSVDYVITLCEEQVCPAVPKGVRKLHWALPDPVSEETEEKMLIAFRKTRDEIQRRLKEWINGGFGG